MENYIHRKEDNTQSRSNIWSNVKTNLTKLVTDSMPQIQETLENFCLEQTQRNDRYFTVKELNSTLKILPLGRWEGL